jgi:hypothetical protein
MKSYYERDIEQKENEVYPYLVDLWKCHMAIQTEWSAYLGGSDEIERVIDGDRFYLSDETVCLLLQFDLDWGGKRVAEIEMEWLFVDKLKYDSPGDLLVSAELMMDLTTCYSEMKQMFRRWGITPDMYSWEAYNCDQETPILTQQVEGFHERI